MDIKNVLEVLKSELSNFLVEEDYKYSSDTGGAGFKSITQFGFTEIVYGITNRNPKFIIKSLNYSLRMNSCERICTMFISKVESISNLDKEVTLLGSYGGLINVKNHDFGEMYSLDDVQKVAQEIRGIYFDILKPFLEQHSDIRFLENEINKDTERDLPYILYWRGRRSMRGIILAKLCHNPRYEELKSIYRQKCIEQDDSDVLEAYDKLIYYLDNEFQW